MNFSTVVAMVGCLAVMGSAEAVSQAPKHPSKFSVEYERCMDASRGVTVAMRDCNLAEDTRLEGLLNRTYAEVLKAMHSPLETRAMHDAERAWVNYRKAQCDLSEVQIGGTLGQVANDDCYLDMAVDRISFLKDYALDQQGNQ